MRTKEEISQKVSINTRINTLRIMAHKTLTISEEAYDALAQLKKEGESFTELIKRITGFLRKRHLKEFAGRLKDEKFEKATLEIRRSGLDVSRLERTKL